MSTTPARPPTVRSALPRDHALRAELNDEVHARPSDALTAPLRISYLALFSDAGERAAEWRHVLDLLARYGGDTPARVLDAPARILNHFSADLGAFTLRWERHAEFTRYTFTVRGSFTDPFAATAIDAVPADWLAGLKGQIMVAAHAALLGADGTAEDLETVAQRWFGGNVLVGSDVGEGAATALTDFRVGADGFSRFLIQDRSMTRRQAGRMVQRILEIDTYRMMALLALPVARELAPFLTRCERELSEVTTMMAAARETDEPELLDRLTRLEAEIESRESANHYRFGAAVAYYDLVQRRIAEMRELRLSGSQTFGEFTERRLAPAMHTCEAVARRQESLSQRVARANQLLSTRVDITRERQNQALLESMNRRAQAQLRLQQTVEGLSIAAVTYYIVGLVGYLAKGVKAAGVGINAELVMALSIPMVMLLAYRGIHHIKSVVTHNAD